MTLDERLNSAVVLRHNIVIDTQHVSLIENIQVCFENLGFEILRFGRHSVSVSATPSTYERVLGVKGPYMGSYPPSGHPDFAELRQYCESFEIESPPMYF